MKEGSEKGHVGRFSQEIGVGKTENGLKMGVSLLGQDLGLGVILPPRCL